MVKYKERGNEIGYKSLIRKSLICTLVPSVPMSVEVLVFLFFHVLLFFLGSSASTGCSL